ncbi:MAG: tRNA epoxyqueuosine(34) reductase QueG [Armatimonadetes bacterium CG_4_10_14_3_um_filter_66_18]|nr:tRNA epoxyqueuosine(34) reductase QueG [Armatimonadota bacterium]OIO94830.1 MAG: tRNA epoxyqueuosine(34) reductase QueG [Armatimonadetes bacterium CG2_30_66_41]PIU93672.1 MAG: tRNA epoxyqueuosine(34) reductase QueG [Armatimonadetes bacterium CG06_land_8_20_14_3_00_66_21]PIY49547.1 MAG: tRNA epoxyqueuosine(34) reductase QueG [Armatimonadetes bacterium CG_4_10_14_3_um_filter_66_18]NCO92686.1 tRNA epoxyqueuosine(34) reductase QueG [Armatimonadota bacterium]
MTSVVDQLKSRALDLGFDAVGIAPAEYGEHAGHFRDWLAAGRHGEMGYLARTAEERTHPDRVLPGAKSVVCVALAYCVGAFPRRRERDPLVGRISRYALNEDYHDAMAAPLTELAMYVRELTGGNTKTCIDTGPVLEKALAERAGIGWIGRNTCLVARRLGTWLFLGEVLTDVELPADQPHANYCSTCQACLKACPTGALVATNELDARRCLSYLTIELKGALPRELRPLVGNRVYGCDTCQDCCPWNLTPNRSGHAAFHPRQELLTPELTELLALSPEEFRQRFRGSPILRIKRKRLLRNVAVALGNSGDRGVVPALAAALTDDEPLVRKHVAWALGRLGGEEATGALRGRMAAEPDPDVREELALAMQDPPTDR